MGIWGLCLQWVSEVKAPEAESNFKINSATMRSRFDYLTSWSFQIFHPSLLTCYITMLLIPKNNWALKRIYWTNVFGAGSFMFQQRLSVAFGGLAPMHPCPHPWHLRVLSQGSVLSKRTNGSS